MSTLVLLVFAGIALIALGAYVTRRRWIGRWLKLPPARCGVTVVHNIPVPMADGTRLLADHYVPKIKAPVPTILIRSPWGRGWKSAPFSVVYMFIAQRFAERGYHVILQDLRSASDAASGGWLVNEARDGHATVAWIGRQPWFDGNLGMWGTSILGYMQWAAAVEAPPFLKALVPVTTASQWYTLIFPDGAFALDTVIRLTQMVNAAGKSLRELMSGGKEQATALAAALQHLPLKEADGVLLGKPDRAYQNWFAQSRRDDPFWQASDHSAKVPQVTAAVHLIAGWHDIFLRGQLADYDALASAGRSPYLTIGPWHHTSPDLAFESVREALQWFEAHLRGHARGLRAQPVRVYVMGADEWRDLTAWPPAAQPASFALHSQGRLLAVPAAAESAPDHYVYDPKDPTPSVGGPLLDPKAAGPQDNSTLEARPDVLCYTTPALESDVEIIGSPRLTLYVCTSAPSTDFFGRVCDVDSDGRSIDVCDGLVRIEPDQRARQQDGSLRLEIELAPTAYRFPRGHRIRLQVSSGAHPRWSRNLGTGEPLGTGTRMVAAEQTIYHDVEHPSVLMLPVVAGG